MRKNILVPIMGVLIIGWTSPVMAEQAEWRSWPLGQRLTVGVSAYRPSLETKVNLTAGPIQATAIDPAISGRAGNKHCFPKVSELYFSEIGSACES